MPATIVLLRIGRAGCPAVPLPFFLLWPAALLAAVLVGLTRLVSPDAGPRSAAWRRGWLGLQAFCQLRGIRVDVRSRSGESVYLWFI